MIIAALIVLGLCLGSFVNALVWRVREQSKTENRKQKTVNRLSILRGRSMCPHCKHELAAKDLLPLVSWLSLKGKCRYCDKPVSKQYPLVELATAALFVASYIWWPEPVQGVQTVLVGLWLLILTGLMALLVYDLKWYLLPDRIIIPLVVIASIYAVISVANAPNPGRALLNTLFAVAVGGGIFYALFQLSEGKWIGGGDVKLGWLLGLVVGTPAKSMLFIFLAALLGTLISLPLLARNRLTKNSIIPFGPFLIAGAILVQLFGSDILIWYQQTFLPATL